MRWPRWRVLRRPPVRVWLKDTSHGRGKRPTPRPLPSPTLLALRAPAAPRCSAQLSEPRRTNQQLRPVVLDFLPGKPGHSAAPSAATHGGAQPHAPAALAGPMVLDRLCSSEMRGCRTVTGRKAEGTLDTRALRKELHTRPAGQTQSQPPTGRDQAPPQLRFRET